MTLTLSVSLASAQEAPQENQLPVLDTANTEAFDASTDDNHDASQPPVNTDEIELVVVERDGLAFQTIDWIELMPEDELYAFLNPPSYITDIEDGSFEDQISNQVESALGNTFDDDYQRALVSTRVIEEMDNKTIRIPGFVVPLTFNDDKEVTKFFLVPFFGACIHVPPPPPNQIIFVKYPAGLKLESLQEPIWALGKIETSLVENGVATAAYSMAMSHYDVYAE